MNDILKELDGQRSGLNRELVAAVAARDGIASDSRLVYRLPDLAAQARTDWSRQRRQPQNPVEVICAAMAAVDAAEQVERERIRAARRQIVALHQAEHAPRVDPETRQLHLRDESTGHVFVVTLPTSALQVVGHSAREADLAARGEPHVERFGQVPV